MTSTNTRGPNLILAGAAAMIVGAFLPWITGTAPFVGTISKSGVSISDGATDGWFVVAAGAFLALLARRDHRPGQITTLGLTLAAGVGLWLVDFNEISTRISHVRAALAGNPFAGAVSADVGIGLWLVAAGLVAGIVGTFMLRSDLVLARLIVDANEEIDASLAP